MKNLRKKLLKHEKLIGTIATVLAVVMFVSLIEIFISNLQDKSNIFILPIVTAVNGFFWSLYAYARKDWFVFIPNFLAMFLGTLTALSVIV